jgi:sodium/hydrogen exchanger 3
MKTLALARLALLACCGAVALAPGVAAGHGRMLAAHTAAGSSAEDYVSADAESAVVYSDVLPHEISRDQFLDIFLTSLVGMMIVITFWELLVGSTPLGQIFPTAAFSLFLGMLFGYLMRVLDLDEAERQIMNFSNRLFLFVLLPPIIYESAFMMDRKTFFHNCGTVMLIVVPGVVLSTAIIGYTTYLFGSLGAFTHDGLTPLDFSSPLQPMLFGSLISATDPVATLAILSTVEIPPVLFVLIFGESLLNDAVSIVLYKVLKWYGKEAFQWAMLPVVIGDFLAISLGSVLVGAGVGLLSAYLHRQLIERTFHSPSGEMTSVILFGYIAYTLAESVNLSGITALVVAGICQRYYTFYSISHEAQHASHHVLKLIASKAEQFVFLYLGINVFLVSGEADLASESVRRVWGADMVIFAAFMLALVMAARLIMVVSMCALANTQRSKKIGLNEMVLMWWAGLRGAMAFALAKDLENEMIVSLTIVVVLFTTFVCGCSTAYVVKRLGLVKAAAPTTLAAQIAALPSELPAIPLPPLAGRPPSISRRTSYAVPLPQQKHRQRAWDLFDKVRAEARGVPVGLGAVLVGEDARCGAGASVRGCPRECRSECPFRGCGHASARATLRDCRSLARPCLPAHA